LRLQRGSATATLERERRRARAEPGTTVYLSDLDPDVLRLLTQRKVIDYLRARRASALAEGDYEIEVVEGRNGELVTPDKPDGIKLELPALPTLWGTFEFALFVAPHDGRRRRVAVVGRAGTTIIDDLAELDEFAVPPWTSDQVQGRVVFEALQQSAGRRAILRDREIFPVFLDTMRAIEPAVARAVERIAKQVDADTADRMADTVRKLFGKVLKELADLDNPMRTPVGTEPGDGALLAAGGGGLGGDAAVPTPQGMGGSRDRGEGSPTSIDVDPEPSDARSRFDADAGVVFYNDRHADYLLVKDDESTLLDYLATLVAKEYVVYNNPRVPIDEFSEEMVRMLVRVRRHLPRRR
jgi:hypothetical protein